jgi:hypothetical protein
MNQLERLHKEGKCFVGKFAQSTVLTMISSNGGKVLEPAQTITGYEIIEEFQEPVLMLVIDGNSVYADTCIFR